MQRCPEPELMTASEQVIAYSDADFNSGDQSFIQRLQELIHQSGSDLLSGSLILDLGCGPGNISERLAVCWPACQVIGLDGSPEMIKMANKRRAALSLPTQNLSYQLVDLSCFRMDDFDFLKGASIILSNSFLHHLHNPQTLWNVVKTFAGSNALIFHRDLRRPCTEGEVDLLCDRYTSEAPPVLRRDFQASLLAAFTADEVSDQLDEACLGCLSVSEIGDRYLEICGRWGC